MAQNFQRVEHYQFTNQLTHLQAHQRKPSSRFLLPLHPQTCGLAIGRVGQPRSELAWNKTTLEGSAPPRLSPHLSFSSLPCGSKQLWAFPHRRALRSPPRAGAKTRDCREARQSCSCEPAPPATGQAHHGPLHLEPSSMFMTHN